MDSYSPKDYLAFTLANLVNYAKRAEEEKIEATRQMVLGDTVYIVDLEATVDALPEDYTKEPGCPHRFMWTELDAEGPRTVYLSARCDRCDEYLEAEVPIDLFEVTHPE